MPEGASTAAPAAAPGTQNEEELRAQLAALEQQLAVARMQQSLSQMEPTEDAPATDPDGEYEEQEVYDEDDDVEEVIVIEEIVPVVAAAEN